MIRLGAGLHNSVVGKEFRLRMRGWRSTAVLTAYRATRCLAPETALHAISDPSPRKSGERLRNRRYLLQLTPRRSGSCSS